MLVEWIWEKTPDGTSRFVLGTVGENPLVCFGINPSTAVPGDLDPTVTRVSKHAARKGHDSWTMFNVYPQISTDPKGMHLELDPGLKKLNERHIAEHIDGRPLTILAAWGTLVGSRPYLRRLARDIVTLPELANCTWVSLGALTKDGHPRHPLYVNGDTPFVPFNVVAYTTN
ncbi:DUF1643 domain-containing protein [Microbacterium sp. SYP-A9085]|uniref:DUF1643 domain-containing protein n=1 Tax=Microbacterium sp. SYP-A9085 TaxID=2664454 RepID=UPI00129C0492|nr:DUF1643 domain-containing protein [Microbacterium sp. SYP-A9085]MRH30142.1 DUF1643 domain-containing protein [Microbacterium sp. SYP-A9085]